jgi:molybdopterin/thiamine biosynthesis adenylyltransferase
LKDKEENEPEEDDAVTASSQPGQVPASGRLPASMSDGKLSSQLTLSMSKVLILGLHWSGPKVASHLAQANVGKIFLVDHDQQFLKDTLQRIRQSLPDKESKTEFVCQEMTFDAHLAEQLISQVDIVIDCLDNWQDKLLASDVCMHLRKTLIHAGGSGMRFQLYAMRPGKSACLRCAFPLAGIDDVPLLPETGDSFETIEAMVAAMQSFEAIKILSRLGVSQGNELIKYDGLSGEFEVVRGLDRRHDCPDCTIGR